MLVAMSCAVSCIMTRVVVDVTLRLCHAVEAMHVRRRGWM